MLSDTASSFVVGTDAARLLRDEVARFRPFERQPDYFESVFGPVTRWLFPSGVQKDGHLVNDHRQCDCNSVSSPNPAEHVIFFSLRRSGPRCTRLFVRQSATFSPSLSVEFSPTSGQRFDRKSRDRCQSARLHRSFVYDQRQYLEESVGPCVNINCSRGE